MYYTSTQGLFVAMGFADPIPPPRCADDSSSSSDLFSGTHRITQKSPLSGMRKAISYMLKRKC